MNRVSDTNLMTTLRAVGLVKNSAIASWGRWPIAAVRLLRVGCDYWVSVRGVGDFWLVDMREAILFAERMAERYG